MLQQQCVCVCVAERDRATEPLFAYASMPRIASPARAGSARKKTHTTGHTAALQPEAVRIGRAHAAPPGVGGGEMRRARRRSPERSGKRTQPGRRAGRRNGGRPELGLALPPPPRGSSGQEWRHGGSAEGPPSGGQPGTSSNGASTSHPRTGRPHQGRCQGCQGRPAAHPTSPMESRGQAAAQHPTDSIDVSNHVCSRRNGRCAHQSAMTFASTPGLLEHVAGQLRLQRAVEPAQWASPCNGGANSTCHLHKRHRELQEGHRQTIVHPP